ncbi:MAG: tetratricopeptide repeat protein [Candidatus Sumerlaeota bacterium]|nr:tetratricopeptide repeat protein [Candidatus Sumerlaeota bacterium]
MKRWGRWAVLAVLVVAGFLVFRSKQTQMWNNQAIRLLQVNKYAEAAQALERARARDPKNGAVLKNLGFAYEKAGQTDKAEEAYKAALQADPSIPEVRERLEEMTSEKGLRDRIAQRIARMKAEGWRDDTVSLQRTLDAAEVSFNVGNYKHAIVLYERALYKDPSDIGIERRIEGLEEKLAKGEY